MDVSHYDELRGRLVGLLIQLGDRLGSRIETWTQELLDHSELGLALETMAEALSAVAASISDEERAEMLNLVAEMRMDELVPSALAQCPSSA